jgi:hypothetical protein
MRIAAALGVVIGNGRVTTLRTGLYPAVRDIEGGL